MSTKKKFKRDYIILESKDLNYRFKDKATPKAFAKVEVNDEKSIVALYVENLRYVDSGYKVVVIQSDFEVAQLGNITVSEQGKGEFILNLDDNKIEVKAIAIVHNRNIPLIGFKGAKIDNYEEIIFVDEEEEEIEEYIVEDDDYDEEDEEIEEIVEYEYIEVEEDDDYDYEDNQYRYEEDDDETEYEYVEVEDTEDEEDSSFIPHRQERKNINSYSEDDAYNDTVKSNFNPKDGNTCLMPRQIKKGLKRFKEAKPFENDYIDNTRWWKIEINPMTMCGYSMPYLGYINMLNCTMYSDIVMQTYKYRHYIFGAQYDEYNKRKYYIYGVPGTKNEQPDQGNTGFTKFVPCDTRNDNLGYWLCFVDSRIRQIKK